MKPKSSTVPGGQQQEIVKPKSSTAPGGRQQEIVKPMSSSVSIDSKKPGQAFKAIRHWFKSSSKADDATIKSSGVIANASKQVSVKNSAQPIEKVVEPASIQPSLLKNLQTFLKSGELQMK